MPAFDDALEGVEPALGDVALDPLAVLNDPFHAPIQPVYVTGCPVCDVARPGCELGCGGVVGVCAVPILPARATAPQVARIYLVM
jgi:hypothetical protein